MGVRLHRRHLPKIKDTETFILHLKEIYGEDFDVSDIVYVNSSTPIKLNCTKHGEYTILPRSLLKGSQCIYCSRELTIIKKKEKVAKNFINRIIKKHGNFYDLSKVVYIDAKTKIELVCPRHGTFFILPHVLVRGSGCQKCGKEIVKNKKLLSKEKCVSVIVKKYGDLYNPEDIQFISRTEPVTLVCKIHGPFSKQLHYLKLGYHCPECGKLSKLNKTIDYTSKFKDLDDFIKHCNIKFNNKFDYSKLSVFKLTGKGQIGCPEHGFFTQKLKLHYNSKYGCHKCADKLVGFNIKISPEEALDRSKKLFPGMFEYDKFVYNGLSNLCVITCPKHGDQELRYEYHCQIGCPKCRMESLGTDKKYTLEEVIAKARLIHSDKYDYHNSTYMNMKTKTKIYCIKEGLYFYQTWDNHLHGLGCKSCAKKLLAKEGTKNHFDFIDEMVDLYGDKYDLSGIEYKGLEHYYPIGCPNHGTVKVYGRYLIKGVGCPRCRGSSAEKQIDFWLDELDIYFIREYTISNYRYRWDFFLPEYNIFIEYHGEQHYMPNTKYDTTDSFNKRLIRDAEKVNIVINEQKGKLIVLSYLDNKNNNLRNRLIIELVKLDVYLDPVISGVTIIE